ncbi:ferritin family protein [Streptomyces sp. YKOK-I1]
MTVPDTTSEARIYESEGLHEDEGAGALGLYDGWEQRNWRIADLDLAADRPAWDALPEVVRTGLLAGLSGLFLGEVSVTETLAPLAHAAPRYDYQLFLCTQLADEARHTLFFQRCLDALTGLGQHRPDDLHTEGRRTEALADVVERRLVERTAAVRPNGDPADWYRAVTLYHLLAEGVLAMTLLHSLSDTVRALPGLTAVSEGLARVARDEARHAAFGIIALRDGVRGGYRDAIAEEVVQSMPVVARALVDPERRLTTLALPFVVARHGRLLAGQWDAAADALHRRLVSIGLRDLTDDVRRAWYADCATAVDEYEELHGTRHPSRLAQQGAGGTGKGR